MQEIQDKIDKKKDFIIKRLSNTAEISSAITLELYNQTETINTSVKKLDNVEENLFTTNEILRRMMSLLPSIFNISRKKIKYQENNDELKKQYDMKIIHPDEKYDEIINEIQRIKLHAEIQSDLLNNNNKNLDIMTCTVDKSISNIKNISLKIEKLKK